MIETNKNNEKIENKKKLKIFGISIWTILTYFIFYSIIGYIIESIFGIITKGVWESRQSFLYGPFCSIYGLGAVFIIVFSQYFKKNNFTLLIGGYIIGTFTEYIISFLLEIFLQTTWWDYSDRILNINRKSMLIIFYILGNPNCYFN